MTTETVTLTDAVPKAEGWTQQALQSAEMDLETAQNIEVTTAEEAEFAGNFVNDVGRRASQVEEMRKSVKRPVLEAANEIDGKFKPVINALNQATGVAKQKLSAYYAEQRRIEEERRKAEREEAERERKRLEQQAKRAERKGDIDRAEEARMEAAMTPEPPRQQAPQPANVTTREEWDFEVTSVFELARAVAARQVPPDALQPNNAYIRKNVKAQTTAFNWPGVRAFVKTSIARRG